MVIVAIAALNFATVRAVWGGSGPTPGLLAFGALPVASVLVIGLLVGRKRPASRPFLLGFVMFGVAALAIYIFLSIFVAEQTLMPYVSLILEPLMRITGRVPSDAYIAAIYPAAVVTLGVPQLVFALLGGYLSRRYKVTITIDRR
jgi:hypothetical protein